MSLTVQDPEPSVLVIDVLNVQGGDLARPDRGSGEDSDDGLMFQVPGSLEELLRLEPGQAVQGFPS